MNFFRNANNCQKSDVVDFTPPPPKPPTNLVFPDATGVSPARSAYTPDASPGGSPSVGGHKRSAVASNSQVVIRSNFDESPAAVQLDPVLLDSGGTAELESIMSKDGATARLKKAMARSSTALDERKKQDKR